MLCKVSCSWRKNWFWSRPNPDAEQSTPTPSCFVDWGSEFDHDHELSFPIDNHPGLLVSHGLRGANLYPRSGRSGLFPAARMAAIRRGGKLHIVAGAPSFFYPVYAVCSAQANNELIELALDGLRSVGCRRSGRADIGERRFLRWYEPFPAGVEASRPVGKASQANCVSSRDRAKQPSRQAVNRAG